MARIHGCHVTSREAILFMKYEHYGKCKGSFKDSQRKCKYNMIKQTNLSRGCNVGAFSGHFFFAFFKIIFLCFVAALRDVVHNVETIFQLR